MSVRVDSKGKIFTDIIQKEEVPALIQTLTNLIHGNIFLRPGIRIKDEFNNNTDAFIAVTDAQVYSATGQVLVQSKFLTINKAHVVWVRPEEHDDEHPPAPAPKG